MGRLNWATLVRQIKSHRAPKALFFKPVCVIAAIDLANEDRLIAENIDANAVIERFSDYVTPFYPDRGKDGYQPLWYLTNDRLWTFFSGEAVVESKAFPGGKPASKAKLFAKFNRLAIPEDLIELWNSLEMRRVLRDSMLLMLDDGDADSRRLVAPLFDTKNLLKRELWPSDAALKTYLKSLRNQLNLFDENPSDDSLRNDHLPNSAPDTVTNLLTSLPPVPEAIESVPSPIDYVWSEGKIFVGPNSANAPVFPNVSAEHSHTQRLEACVIQAQDLIRDLRCRKWNVRDDYEIEIKRYLDRLPTATTPGNVLLADTAARILHDLFAAERDILAAGFAARLKAMLQQHIALRPFYPEIEECHRAIKTGRIDDPLPLDAVTNVISIVRAQTPIMFDESVSNAIREATLPEPQVTVVDHGVSRDDTISPPPDPLGELDPTKARDFQTAGWINRLWKVFKAGAVIHTNTNEWIATYHSLSNPIKLILVWLGQFIDR